MRLMDGISIVVAKLLNNLFDPLKLFTSSKVSDDALKTTDMISNQIRQCDEPDILTLTLQPSSYHKVCRSKHAGYFGPF